MSEDKSTVKEKPLKWRGQPPDYAEVALSVYELHGTQLVGCFTGKLYHVGVEVYWLEWSYGAGDASTGIGPCRIHESTLGNFVESVPLGRTPFTPHGVIKILENMRPRWLATDYDIVHKNCQFFSVEFVRQLKTPEKVPDWVTALAESLGGSSDEAQAAARRASVAPLPLLVGGGEGDDNDSAFGDEETLEERAANGDWAAAVEVTWRICCKEVLEKAEMEEKASRYEDFSMDLSYQTFESCVEIAAKIAVDRRFHNLVRDATAAALRVGTAEGEDGDWLQLKDIRSRGGLQVLLRLHSSPESPLDWPPPKPPPEEFEPLFLTFLHNNWQGRCGLRAWPEGADRIQRSLRVFTAPGMLPAGRRVLMPSGKSPSAEVKHSECPVPSLPRREDTLSKLMQMRQARWGLHSAGVRVYSQSLD